MKAPERDEIRVSEETVADLRERLRRTRWPAQPDGDRWALGSDLPYVREVCEHWRKGYAFTRLERLNALGSWRWNGIHFLRVVPEGDIDAPPIVLLHGWPSGPIEYERAARLLAVAGREVIVPSLPGFAWSDEPGEPLGVVRMAERLVALLADGLGLERFIVAGGDWGAPIAARIAIAAPERTAGLYISTPGALPRPAELSDPPLSEDELSWVEGARRWLRGKGHHMVVQSAAPDVLSTALSDSPGGLAAYLIEKYRRWSDSEGDVERRFSRDDLCDFLTMFWSTGCIASSMRIYYAERHSGWRLGPGERIEVPTGIGAFEAGMRAGDRTPEVIGNPPRDWTARVVGDLRHWSEPPTGAHFSAFEEPDVYVGDLLRFADAL